MLGAVLVLTITIGVTSGAFYHYILVESSSLPDVR
jgi:hypothetical protein